METDILFKEKQLGLKNWGLTLVLLFTLIPLCIYLFLQMTKASGSDKIILFCTLIFTIALCLFFVFIKLKTEITQKKIKYRLSPFHFSTQTLSKSEIVEVENVVYNPIGEWGGWGIRYDFRGNKAYTMYGNKGVQVTLKNGKMVLFGSQKSNKLYEAIIKNTNLSK